MPEYWKKSVDNYMNIVEKLFLALAVLILSGCASVFTGVEQKMTFKSEPEGASVYVDDLLIGKTPLDVDLRKDEYKKITFKLHGYEDQTILLKTRFQLAGLLNLFFLPGFTIDASTGGMFQYEPGKYYVALVKSASKKIKAYIDRNYLGDFKGFVTANFYRAKAQCRIVCDNEYTETISYLASRAYNLDINDATKLVISNIPESTDSDDFIQRMDVGIKSEFPQRFVATK